MVKEDYKEGDVFEEITDKGEVERFKVVKVEKIGFMTRTTIEQIE